MCVGVWAAVIVTFLLNNSFLANISEGSTFLFWSTIVIFTVVFGVFSCKIWKHLIIWSTGLVGGYAAIRPFGFFIGNFPNELTISNQIASGEKVSVEATFYLYFVLMLIFAGFGMKYQYKYFLVTL
jgi:hypothetical protein